MQIPRIVALVVGVILVLATALAAAAGFAHDSREVAIDRADLRRAALQSLTGELDAVVATTHQVAGLFAASSDVSAEEFRTFTEPILRDGSAASFAWAPRVSAAQRAGWEHRRGVRISELGSGGAVRTAGARSQYDPTLFIESAFAVSLPPALDVGSIPLRRRTLAAAALHHAPRSTPVTRLVGSGRPGIAVYVPVHDSRGRLRGSAVGTFRVEQLVKAMQGVMPKGAAFAVHQGGRRVAEHGRPAGTGDRWVVDVAAQRWEVVTSPAPAKDLNSGVIALLVGGLLTAFVVLGLSGLLREAGRARRDASVSEERFAQAFDNAPVGMAILDAEGRHAKVNEAMARMLGRTRDELAGLAPEGFMPPSEAAACRRLVAALARGDQTSFRGDTTVLSADGRPLRVAVHMTLLDQAPDAGAAILVHSVDVTEQRMAEERMRHLADHDPLTGLLNRRGLAAALEAQVAHRRRYGAAGALLILDLDGFKAVNDTLGHETGDQLLSRVGIELRACLRETDVLARLGGDEFAVILPRETLAEAAVVAAKITTRLREARLHGVTASVGVAAFGPGQEDPDELLRAADLAMYSAKAAGRDRHAVHGQQPDLV